MLVMSIMGVILFDFPELDTRHFLSAIDAWFVLFICVTQDGWNQVLDQFREASSMQKYRRCKFGLHEIFTCT
jgi:hypothetical protein